MIVVPMLSSDLWDECPYEYTRGDHFPSGFMITLNSKPKSCNRKSDCLNPKQLIDHVESPVKELSPEHFELRLNVQMFKPEEISVKATNQSIIVEAKHEEDNGNSYECEEFIRRIRLPPGYDSEQIVSSMSSDGVLTISAPKLALPEPVKERTIAIKYENMTNAEQKQDESKTDQSFTLEDLDE
ncbi:protein lethal(2)essential for life-like [Armigeres subalbatus]|uniref:protein lethal(2)essential for life-like n=1 Tax=Armigeres subalbatus TaxID=124917 RepID=UPI002ED14DE0